MQVEPARPDDGYRVLGQTLRVPVEIRDVRAFSATFFADADRVDARIAHTGLRSLRVSRTRTLTSLAALDYRDGDWGAYRELAICFPVLAPGARASRLPLLAAASAIVR